MEGESMKEIDSNQTVYQLIQENPDLKAILVDLGFAPLNNEKMLKSLGRMMSLKDGMKQVGIDEEELAKALAAANYELKK